MTKASSHELSRLEFLYFHRTRSSFAFGVGFVSTESIRSEFGKIGTSETDIAESLRSLGSLALVENDVYDFQNISAAYRITPAGRYYMRYLSGRFSYLDLVLQDTPISDREVFQTIKDLIGKKEMEDRFRRVTEFVLYLTNEEEREYPAIISTSESLPLRRKLMPEKVREVQDDKVFITEGIARRRERLDEHPAPPATPYTVTG